MEKGIKYLRELAVQEIIHSHTQITINPDEVPCTRPLLQKAVESAPSTYAHSATITLIQDDEAAAVSEVANKLWWLEDSVSSTPRGLHCSCGKSDSESVHCGGQTQLSM